MNERTALLSGNKAVYRLSENQNIGRGYFAKVFRATLERASSTLTNVPAVALKIQWAGDVNSLLQTLRDHTPISADQLYASRDENVQRTNYRRFVNEQAVLSFLSETPYASCTPTLYEFSETPLPFYAMEFIDSAVYQSVADRLAENGAFPEALALHIMEQYVGLMACLHESMRRVNDDMQLQNLFWSPEHGLKVIDWNGVSLDSIDGVNVGPNVRQLVRTLYQLLTGQALPAIELLYAFHLAAFQDSEQVSPGTRALIRGWLFERDASGGAVAYHLPPDTTILDIPQPASVLRDALIARRTRWVQPLESLLAAAQAALTHLERFAPDNNPARVQNTTQAKDYDAAFDDVQDWLFILRARSAAADSQQYQQPIDVLQTRLDASTHINSRFETALEQLFEGRPEIAADLLNQLIMQQPGMLVERWYAVARELQTQPSIGKALKPLATLYAPYHMRPAANDWSIDWIAVNKLLQALRIDLPGTAALQSVQVLTDEAAFQCARVQAQQQLSLADQAHSPEVERDYLHQAATLFDQAVVHGQALLEAVAALNLFNLDNAYRVDLAVLLKERAAIELRQAKVTQLVEVYGRLAEHFTQADVETGLNAFREAVQGNANPTYLTAIRRAVLVQAERLALAYDWLGLENLLSQTIPYLGSQPSDRAQLPRMARALEQFMAVSDALQAGQYVTALQKTIVFFDAESFANALPHSRPAFAALIRDHYMTHLMIDNAAFEGLVTRALHYDAAIEPVLRGLRTRAEQEIKARRESALSEKRQERHDQAVLAIEALRARVGSSQETPSEALNDVEALAVELLEAHHDFPELTTEIDAILNAARHALTQRGLRIQKDQLARVVEESESDAQFQDLMPRLHSLRVRATHFAEVAPEVETLWTRAQTKRSTWLLDLKPTLEKIYEGLQIYLLESEEALNLCKAEIAAWLHGPVTASLTRAQTLYPTLSLRLLIEDKRAALHQRLRLDPPDTHDTQRDYARRLLSWHGDIENTTLLEEIGEALEPLTRTLTLRPEEWGETALPTLFELVVARIAEADTIDDYRRRLQFLVLAERLRYLAKDEVLGFPDFKALPYDIAMALPQVREYAARLGRQRVSWSEVRSLVERAVSRRKREDDLAKANVRQAAAEEKLLLLDDQLKHNREQTEQLRKRFTLTIVAAGMLLIIAIVLAVLLVVSMHRFPVAV